MLKISSETSAYGTFAVCGDKSVTVRAILLGAIYKGETRIKNAEISLDALSAIDCARKLGAKITRNKTSVTVIGTKNITDGQTYNCGNCATLARLLIGLLSGARVNAIVTGDQSLSARPMTRVVDPLVERGAKISCGGGLPVYIQPSELKEYYYVQSVASAQVKSAVLLSGVTSGKDTSVSEKIPTRAHTEKMLEFFGADINSRDGKITLRGKSEQSGRSEQSEKTIDNTKRSDIRKIEVPRDFSAAANYLALGLLGGSVTVRKVLLNDLRGGFYKKLSDSGASFFIKNLNEQSSRGDEIYRERTADITASKSAVKFFTVESGEIASMIDEIPVICVVAAFNGGCVIRGASELRHKECDRLTETVKIINAAGGKAVAEGDNLTVYAQKPERYFVYDGADHRMIMAAYLIMRLGAGGEIAYPQGVAISFPDFFNNLSALPMCLIGKDVSRSSSGYIHKFILDAAKKENYCYSLQSLDIGALCSFFEKSSYKSINVTIPYKEEIEKLGMKMDESANLCKSVNFVFGGTCYSFDGEGFVLALGYQKIDCENKTFAIYGAGGAAASIAFSLCKRGCKVYISNRTIQRAENLIKRLNDKFGANAASLYEGQKADIAVNASALCDINSTLETMAASCAVAIDINYKLPSAFLQSAKNCEATVSDGRAMLFFQAYLADMLIIGKKICSDRAFFLYNSYCHNNNGI